MGWWYDDDRPKPRRPANGIKAKSQRGKFAASWWATRWINALEQLMDANRLSRGRTYARQGQVVSIDTTPGHVAAKVQGSQRTPYKVSINLPVLSDTEWERTIDALAGQAIFAAKLLVGEMPQHVEEAFAAAKTNLFPTKRGELRTSCSCPDSSNPCKHIAAVYYLLGEQFDQDPFLIFALRGRTREQIIAALHERRTGETLAPATPPTQAEATSPLETQITNFWQLGDQDAFEALRFSAVEPPVVAAPLKVLGAPPFWPDRAGFLQSFEPLYRAISNKTRKRIQGDDV